MLARLARFCVSHRLLVALLWIVALAVVVAVGSRLGPAYENDFRLPASESREAFEILEQEFPGSAGDSVRVVFAADAGVTSSDVRQRVEALLQRLGEFDHVVSVQSPYVPGGQISGDGKAAIAVVNFDEPAINLPRELLVELRDTILAANQDDLRVEASGNAIGLADMPELGRAELVGLGVAVVVLIVAFGSVAATGLPIATAILTLALAMSAIAALSHTITIPMFAPDLARMIGLGVGIDYALLVVTRFRQNLHAGAKPSEAAVTAVATAGRSVLFAGVIVAVSLAGLVTMGLSFVNGLALSSGLSVVFAIATSLTVLPAALATLGHKVDALRIPLFTRDESDFRNTLSYRWSRAVQRRPWITAAAAAVLLMALGMPALSIDLGASDEGNQPPTKTQRRAYDLISEHFGPGYNGTILVVARSPQGQGAPEKPGTTSETDGDAGSPRAKDTDVRPPMGQSTLPEQAASVASATASDATVSQLPPLPPAVGELVQRISQLESVQLVAPPVPSPSGKAFMFQVIPKESPQDHSTRELVHAIREDVAPTIGDGQLEVKVGGITAVFVDLSDYLADRLFWLIGAVVALSFVLLTIVFRSLLVPLKAAVMNVLSIGAAYGVVVAVFQWGWLKELVGAHKTGPIEPFIPMMLFAILFGLSMDYEVFLISRIREEYDRTGDAKLSVADGLAATARVISSAASIMIAVFLAFAWNDNRIVKLFGIGLASAIFVDATVVRLVLVPSTMELLGKANWWLPGWLDRLLPKVAVEAHRSTLTSETESVSEQQDDEAASESVLAGAGEKASEA